MGKDIRFVGLDVSANEISVAVADGRDAVRFVGNWPNRIESIRKLVKKLGGPKGLHVSYEAGPTGYALYWQLTEMGVTCEVVAPTLIPTRPGDRVKTNRKDALTLGEAARAGTLTAVWVPDRAHEALRDLVRARGAAKTDQHRARQRVGKLLLRHGVRPPERMNAWTQKHRAWLDTIHFDELALQATFLDYLHEVTHQTQRLDRLERAIDEAVAAAPEEIREVIAALQALRGVAKTTAVGVVAEVGKFSRFDHPKRLMGYVGDVPSEYSTGNKIQKGAITKTGNKFIRRLVSEAAWAYRHAPRVTYALRRRQQNVDAQTLAIAWKAQTRLCARYRSMCGRQKEKNKVATAIGRELLGFMWAIATAIEQKHAA